MWKKFNDWLIENRDYGISLPLAYDPVSQKASFTLLVAWVGFWISAIGNIILWFRADIVTAALINILFSGLMIVFYLIRSITKAKFDIENKSFELSNNEKEEN